jgi:hypothetical protein
VFLSWATPAHAACSLNDGCVSTAIGEVNISSGDFVAKFFSIGIGVGSMIAFLLILFGALQMMTSAGNPEKLNAGKELVTAAITGLLFIIFSIFLLRIIGVDILGIPGFT